MKLFISWSGDKARQCALVLEEWIKKMNHTIQPFCSPTGIAKGELARVRIAEELRESDVGIVCVTRGNQTAPWLNFEAGALSKAVSYSRVMPFLIDLRDKDLKSGPLASFQATDSSDKDHVWEMVKTINDACASPVQPGVLRSHFDKYWGELDAKLQRIRATAEPVTEEPRKTPEILNELVRLVRDQNIRLQVLERRLEAAGTASAVTTPARPDPDVPVNDGVDVAWNLAVVQGVHKIIDKRHIQEMSPARTGITVRCDAEGHRRATENYGLLQTLASHLGTAIEVTDDEQTLVFEP
ncbi:hypothetical protein ACWCPI_21270 [Streptomyces sp. NPDC001920]